jgi:2,4-dienoyl-CoA reductase-like NADH-dependent reductase (Old Yellow Enzyme family)
VNQFLSPLTNLREDGWGGSVDGRARFLLEIVRAVRARTGRGFTLSVKLNSADFQRGGFAEDDALAVVRLLDAEGVDLLEISGGNYEQPVLFGVGDASAGEPKKHASTVAREAYFLDFARRVRAVAKLPLMVTGGFRTRAAMEAALAEGALDVVGLARPLALEPDLPRRLLDGTAEHARAAAPRRLASHALSMLAEGAWFWRQLVRMGRGLDPDPNMGIYYTMLVYLLGDMLHALSRRRRPRSLPPPARERLPA